MTSPPAVDIEQLLNLCGHDPDGSFRREMIDSYAARGPKLLAQMNVAVGHADRHQLQSTAHQFRGMAANVGANKVATESAALENAARQGVDADFVAMVAMISANFTESLDALRAYDTRGGTGNF